jgi:hypothetical protein
MQVKVLIDAIEEVLSSGKSMEQILIDHETGRKNMVIGIKLIYTFWPTYGYMYNPNQGQKQAEENSK